MNISQDLFLLILLVFALVLLLIRIKMGQSLILSVAIGGISGFVIGKSYVLTLSSNVSILTVVDLLGAIAILVIALTVAGKNPNV